MRQPVRLPVRPRATPVRAWQRFKYALPAIYLSTHITGPEAAATGRADGAGPRGRQRLLGARSQGARPQLSPIGALRRGPFATLKSTSGAGPDSRHTWISRASSRIFSTASSKPITSPSLSHQPRRHIPHENLCRRSPLASSNATITVTSGACGQRTVATSAAPTKSVMFAIVPIVGSCITSSYWPLVTTNRALRPALPAVWPGWTSKCLI